MGLVADWEHVIICFGGGFVQARSVLHEYATAPSAITASQQAENRWTLPCGWRDLRGGTRNPFGFLNDFHRLSCGKMRLISSSAPRACELAAGKREKGSNTWVMAPNHRHYPEPQCCAIPALKQLYTVPVRLAWHYHTCIGACVIVSTYMNAHPGWGKMCTLDGSDEPLWQQLLLTQELIVFFWGQSVSEWTESCNVVCTCVCYSGALCGYIIYSFSYYLYL